MKLYMLQMDDPFITLNGKKKSVTEDHHVVWCHLHEISRIGKSIDEKYRVGQKKVYSSSHGK